MAAVFVSYIHADRAAVRRLVEAIRAGGHEVWWDDDIAPGAPWETTIERELAAARTGIVCWSPAAVRSENVRAEARRTKADGRLIQLFIAPCDPPLFFGERQGIELFTDGAADGPAMQRLLRQLGPGTGAAPPPVTVAP